MSQHDHVLDNASGASFRADLNLALLAIASRNSGATAPSATYPYLPWFDTTSGTIKRRNAADNGWIVEATLDETIAVSRSSNTILDESDKGKFITATATFTQTLTAAATLTDGWYVWYRVNEGATITFDPNSSEQINGAVTLDVSGPATLLIWCNGTAFTAVVIRHGALTYPLMDYGGMNFDGSTDYLDTNALTGITDTKKGTFVWKGRLANAASAAEIIVGTTGVAFDVRRTATGAIQIVGENAAGTVILDIVTTGTPCSAAGEYVILASWDLATAASARIYVNDKRQAITENTFTNDTIDYTVTEYSVGSNVAGSANFFTGDMYVLYLNELVNLEFNTESVRRKFHDVDSVMTFMGRNGELPTGSAPICFHAYDPYSAWTRQRGRASTSWTVNGTPVVATTAISGQYGDRENGAITVTADYTVLATDKYITVNKGSAAVLTLPDASTCRGRSINVRVVTAHAVTSASSNVQPIAGGAAGTAILPGVDGSWALLVSDGGGWNIMAS